MRERAPGTWELCAYVGRDANGKVRQVTRTVKGGTRAATKALAELEAEAGVGKHGTARMTVAGLLEGAPGQPGAAGSLAEDDLPYRAYARTVIGPDIGSQSVRKLTWMRSTADWPREGRAPGGGGSC
jgi:hypothetical protein